MQECQPMGRYGSTENEPYEEEEQIDWSALRRPAKKIRIRLTPTEPKPKAIPAKKKRLLIRSDVRSTIRPEQTEERNATTIKAAIRKAIENNPDIATRKLQAQFPNISLVLLSALKIEYRKQLKRSGRL
jgi:hypothetical protein